MASALDESVTIDRAIPTPGPLAALDPSVFRLAKGGLIERQQVVSFTFDGKSYRGFAGDTLAAALLANGVRLIGRSFKYHRPRGIVTAGPEEPRALVDTLTENGQEAN